MSRNNHSVTGNLLDYFYHQNYYKIISIDLSTQKKTNIPQQINFIGKLEKENGATMFFFPEKQQKTIFNTDSLVVYNLEVLRHFYPLEYFGAWRY